MRGRIDLWSACRFMAIFSQTNLSRVHCVLLSGMKYVERERGTRTPHVQPVSPSVIGQFTLAPFARISNDPSGEWRFIQSLICYLTYLSNNSDYLYDREGQDSRKLTVSGQPGHLNLN